MLNRSKWYEVTENDRRLTVMIVAICLSLAIAFGEIRVNYGYLGHSGSLTGEIKRSN